MSQYAFETINPATKSGSALASDLNAFRDALYSTHKGSTAPSYAAAGLRWIDDSGGAVWLVKIHDGTDWIVEAVIDTTNNIIYPISGDPVLAYPVAGGSANALTLTPSPALTSYLDGKVITFTAPSDNTGPATLNVSGVGAKSIRLISGGADVALSANDLRAACKYTAVYDSAANSNAGGWVLTDPVIGMLGNAALKNTGSGPDTVAAGNDPRIVGAAQKSGDTFTGSVASTYPDAWRIVGGTGSTKVGSFFRNDGYNFYLMLTNPGDEWGQWNSLRPFAVDVNTGLAVVQGNPTNTYGIATPNWVYATLANQGAGGMGTYAFLYYNGASGNLGPGSLIGGGNTAWSSTGQNNGGTPPGSWRCMGSVGSGHSTLFVRYA